MIRHVDTDVQEVKALVLEMGGCVEKALDEVCNSFDKRDLTRLLEVHRQEERINELQVRLDNTCVEVMAKQAPVAKDLRFFVSSIRINTDLERMGDQCKNLAYCVKDLYSFASGFAAPSQLKTMMTEVKKMVRLALDAFVSRNVELSKQILVMDDLVDDLRDHINRELTAKMKADSNSIDACFQMIMMAKNLERLADHATNVAEEVIFACTGDDVRHGFGG